MSEKEGLPKRPKPFLPSKGDWQYDFKEIKEYFEKLAKELEKRVQKAESCLKLCENRLLSYKKEIVEKTLDKDFKRIHDIAEDFDLWRFARDLSKERVEELKELLEAIK